MKNQCKLIVIGGGAAGFFAAIKAAEENAGLDITILEQGNEVLGKVKISAAADAMLRMRVMMRESWSNFIRAEAVNCLLLLRSSIVNILLRGLKTEVFH